MTEHIQLAINLLIMQVIRDRHCKDRLNEQKTAL